MTSRAPGRSKKSSSPNTSSNAPHDGASKSTARTADASPGPAIAEPDLAEAMDLVMQLMAIPGVSGHEAAVAQFVTDHLIAAGADAKPRFGPIQSVHHKTPLQGRVVRQLDFSIARHASIRDLPPDC